MSTGTKTIKKGKGSKRTKKQAPILHELPSLPMGLLQGGHEPEKAHDNGKLSKPPKENSEK